MRQIALFPLVSFFRQLDLFLSRILFHVHLFVGKILTIVVANVKFQITFVRHVSARDRPVEQEKMF